MVNVVFKAVLLVCLVALVGCTPTVSLKAATLQGVSVTGPRFESVLAFHNPNSFDIQVRAVRANVRVGTATIPVVHAPNVWIPANRTVNISVPVTVPWTAVPGTTANVAMNSEIAYTIRGNADVTASRALAIDQDTYRFDEEGTLPRSFFVQTNGGFPIGIGTPSR
jgi:hypothetical protein